MGLHNLFDGAPINTIIPLVDESQDTGVDPGMQSGETPPWLDLRFLTRLDALNGISSISDADRLRPGLVRHNGDVPESIATFAHEIRTPLATLQATVELLGDGHAHDAQDYQQLVARLQRGVQWITQLVDHISTEVPETSPQESESTPAVVYDWIQQAITLVQPMADRRQQTILLACPQPSPVVYGDAFRLGQVMVNLLTNACRYGAWADTIAVSVAADRASVTIRVSDHGMGIEPDERDRIFERRQRGTGSHDRCEEGQGLGLSIAQQIVVQHLGTISVDSTVGQGSTFTVRLPIMRAPRPLYLRHTTTAEGDANR